MLLNEQSVRFFKNYKQRGKKEGGKMSLKRIATKKEWLEVLKYGDVGICKGKSFFSRLQDWFRKKRENQVEAIASHGFFVKDSPQISEADGKKINGSNKINRYFSDYHTIWIFRSTILNNLSLKVLKSFINGAEQSGGLYSWGGIIEFVKKFFRKKHKMKDKRGMFCTEYVTKGNINAHIPFIDYDYVAKALRISKSEAKYNFAHRVSPSMLLDWLIDVGCENGTWESIAFYSEGRFYLNGNSNNAQKSSQ